MTWIDMGDIEYERRHWLVRKVRGKAREHLCVDCGKQALDWSQIHGTDGTDPECHYEPRCRSCHSIYDGIRERSIGNTHGKANTGKVRTKETREKLSMVHRGMKHKPESIAKQKRNWKNQYGSAVIDPDDLD